LHDTAAIAQIHKNHAAMIATTIDPTTKRDGFSNVFCA
jgi:hypothetical protein